MTDYIKPDEIESAVLKSYAGELPHALDPALEPVILRVIHATADFEYADSLSISNGVIERAIAALHSGAVIASDTNMVTRSFHKLLKITIFHFLQRDL